MNIAISGKMGSGKTTFANYLIEKHGYTHASFARQLKDSAMELFGLSYEQAYGSEKDREFLQKFGQSMRELDDDVWVKKLVNSLDDDSLVIIDDMRHINEYNAMSDAGFLLIRMEATEDIRKERLGERFKNSDHISETALDTHHFPIVVENIGSLESLYNVADAIYEKNVRAPEVPPTETSQ